MSIEIIKLRNSILILPNGMKSIGKKKLKNRNEQIIL